MAFSKAREVSLFIYCHIPSGFGYSQQNKMDSVTIPTAHFAAVYGQRLYLLVSVCYSHCTNMMRRPGRKTPLTLGHPIGAGSTPVGKRISKGNGVPFCLGCSEGIRSPLTGRIQRNQRFCGTRFCTAKSSVLYLCGADGSRKCSTPLNLCCISGVLLGKVAP